MRVLHSAHVINTNVKGGYTYFYSKCINFQNNPTMKHTHGSVEVANQNEVELSKERRVEKDIMGLMGLAFFHTIAYISLYSKKDCSKNGKQSAENCLRKRLNRVMWKLSKRNN